jgi:two-component system, NarL family, response regulator NreC
MATRSVLIVDRHALVRRALRALLCSDGDLNVVGEAADVGRALADLRANRPDVVLVGPGHADPSVIARVRAAAAAARVVVVSDRPCRCGCAALRVPEDAPAHLLRAAVRGPVEPGAAERLSARERDVLALIGLGHTNPEIAGRLRLSVRTVEAHRARLQRKLRTTSRAQLVRHALDRGLVS